MFDRDAAMNRDYINILGLDANGVAGNKREQVGFQNYAAKLHQARMMTGTVIGARSAISWLARTGFNMDNAPFLKEFIRDEGINSAGWKALDKFYDTVQKALDIHGGIHKSLATRDKLQDFLYYGITDMYAESTGDVVFDRHNKKENSLFNDKHNFGSKLIHKEIFKEILRTL